MHAPFQPLPPDFDDAIARVRDRLGRLCSHVLFVPVTGSTNDLAWSLAGQDDAEGAVIIADAQTSGRGRLGREWFSPPGGGLYVSVVLAPAQTAAAADRALALLTLAAGVALAQGVEAIAGLSPAIKWPNDLLVNRRKLAGILAEGNAIASPTGARREALRSTSRVVLGYGINVGPIAFPSSLSDRATSLESELGRPIDRAMLCAETLAMLAARYDDLLAGRFDAILDAWRSRAPGSRGAHVTWTTPAGPRTGVTAGIDEHGALLVANDHGVERLIAGEVTWL
jgi:BirA family biotin operon repressor/biotin-[acetyl-CoA-carboxylase] ligase